MSTGGRTERPRPPAGRTVARSAECLELAEEVRSVTAAEAVERMYAVFARHPLAARIDGCPHCVTDEDQRRLRRAPLRELEAEDLSRFTDKAVTTWGGVDDLKHFLPRIVDIALSVGGGIDIDTVAAKLDLARWREWPRDERAAVLGCFAALWRETLDLDPEERPAVLVLDTLATAFDDLGPFLEAWTERLRAGTRNPSALRQLADTSGTVVATSPGSRNQQVVSWLLARHPRLERLFYEARQADPVLAEALADARAGLDLLRRSDLSHGTGWDSQRLGSFR
ncbi:hypothetical protein ACOALZ_01680 [Nocardiopsis algeriensis]|uniref:hypothetical protein n=1 Tax=Nocardiopsis algeriensis TaxID=1478215 RepID=UPI003B431FA3